MFLPVLIFRTHEISSKTRPHPSRILSDVTSNQLLLTAYLYTKLAQRIDSLQLLREKDIFS